MDASLDSRELPPFPPVADALLRLTMNENVGLAEVSEVVSTDAAVSLEVLRVVNTGFVGVRGEVAGIAQAAAILGLRRIASIAGAVAIRSYLGRMWRSAQVRRCWHHNLASALVAEHMARILFLDADAAHAAGLLHDIGRFVLIVQHEGDYIRLLQHTTAQDGDLRARELEMFGIDHNEAGRALLERLGMPHAVLEVAAAHHDAPGDEGTQMVHLVRGACKLATAMGYGLHDDPDRPARAPIPPPLEIEAMLAGLPHAYRSEVARHYELIRDTTRELVSAYDHALV